MCLQGLTDFISPSPSRLSQYFPRARSHVSGFKFTGFGAVVFNDLTSYLSQDCYSTLWASGNVVDGAYTAVRKGPLLSFFKLGQFAMTVVPLEGPGGSSAECK